MKQVLFLIVATSIAFNSHAMTAEQACEELKPVIAELRAQTPMKLDYMTVLTGTQLIYAVKTCMLNYSYSVDSKIFLQEMADENELSLEENLNFLQTEAGNITLKEVFGDIADNAAITHFQAFKPIKGMKITYTHSFDNPEILPVVSTVMENAQ